IWVVEPVDVAGAHRVERVRAQDGLEHPGTAARDVTGHDAPASVEHADEVVLLLLDEGRHRTALHQELHVADRRGETAADDLERDGIDDGALRHDPYAPPRGCGRGPPAPGSRAPPGTWRRPGPRWRARRGSSRGRGVRAHTPASRRRLGPGDRRRA